MVTIIGSIVIGCYIHYKTRYFANFFKFQDEIRYTIVIAIFNLILCLTSILATHSNILQSVANLNDRSYVEIETTIYIGLSQLSMVSITIITMHTPILWYQNQKTAPRIKSHTGPATVSKTTRLPKLLSVLRHEKGFQLFMQYLATECSSGM